MYLDIFQLYLYPKIEKSETKKIGHFAECISQNTRQYGLNRIIRKGSTPGTRQSFESLPECQLWHSANRRGFAECHDLALGKTATWGNRCRGLHRVPDADTRHSLKLCRVSAVRHSAKPRAKVAPRGGFAERQSSRQNLCRVPGIRHSANPPLPSGALPSVTLGKGSGLCRV